MIALEILRRAENEKHRSALQNLLTRLQQAPLFRL